MISNGSGRGTDADVQRTVCELFAANDNPKDPDVVAWQYGGPLGGAYVAIAHDGDDPFAGAAALYAAFPVPFQVGSVTGTMVQSFDTLTSASHRGQGLFGRLANVVYEQTSDDGVLGVYGVPNGASVSGFTGRLDWELIDPLPMLVRPVGSRYGRVRARIRRPEVVEPARSRDGVVVSDSCPDELAPPLSVTEPAADVGLDVTDDYRRWRLARPNAGYRFVSVDGVDGTAVVRVEPKHGCVTGYVLELFAGDPGSARTVLRAAVQHLADAGADLVLAWAMPATATGAACRRAGFLPLPERIRPIELHLGYRPFRDGLDAMRDRRRWRISYLDSDTV